MKFIRCRGVRGRFLWIWWVWVKCYSGFAIRRPGKSVKWVIYTGNPWDVYRGRM